MDFKLPFILLVIGVGVAGAIPFGISQLSPEDAFMEIDMLQTQVENPFRIQDHNDVDVFCIDPQGYIACNGTRFQEIAYHSGSGTIAFSNIYGDLPTDQTFAHDSVLAQWSLDVDGATLWNVYSGNSYMTSEIQRISGAGACGFDLELFIDSSQVWSQYANMGNSGTSATWQLRTDTTVGDIEIASTDWRVIVYATAGSTSCEIKNIDTIIPIFVPENYLLTRTK